MATSSRLVTIVIGMVAGITAVLGPGHLNAQNDDQEIEEPQVVTLDTRDFVRLQCRWYPGNGEKKSIPFIMVHGWDGNMDEYDHLAKEMQKQGHSVIVPNMRGHGGSLSIRNSDVQIDREKMNRAQIAAMVNDVDAARKFLLEKNDEGKLNIDMLTIVASEEMCIIAAEWALADWSWPTIGGRRQGQYVKSIIFLSPVRRFKGLTLNTTIRDPLFSGRGATPFSMLIAVGNEDSQPLRDARSMFTSLERTRPKVEPQGDTAEERTQDLLNRKDLYFESYDVDYQGTNLVHPQAPLDLVNKVGAFVYYRLTVKESDYPWSVQRSRD